MSERRRKHWGWGFEDEQPSAGELREAAAGLAAHLGFGSAELEAPAPPRLDPPRVEVPAGLRGLVVQDDHARAVHAHGASYGDVVRAFRGDFPHAPDAVALPGSEEELLRVLEWCADARLAVTPYGGGTSVVGGVDPVRGAPRGRGLGRPVAAGPRARGRRRLARRADRGGRGGAAAGGAARRAAG